MKQIAVLLFITGAFAGMSACKKSEETHPFHATWYVNGEKYSSDNISFSTNSKNVSTYSAGDKSHEGFYFFFANGAIEYLSGKSTFSRGISASPCWFYHRGVEYSAPADTFYKLRYTSATPDSYTPPFFIDTLRFYYYAAGDTSFRRQDSITVWGSFDF